MWLFFTIHYSLLLEEFADGEDEFAFAGVADGGADGDDADWGFGDDAEVDVGAQGGGGVGSAHLADLAGDAKVEAGAEWSGQRPDAAQVAGRDEEVVGAAVLVDGAGGEAQRAAEGWATAWLNMVPPSRLARTTFFLPSVRAKLICVVNCSVLGLSAVW